MKLRDKYKTSINELHTQFEELQSSRVEAEKTLLSTENRPLTLDEQSYMAERIPSLRGEISYIDLKIYILEKEILAWEDIFQADEQEKECLEISEITNESILDALFELSHLTELRLEGCPISFSSKFGKLKNLRILSLNRNNLDEIPTEVWNLTKLNRLMAENNKLTEIPAEIKNLKKLKDLNLSSNSLVTIPVEIGEILELESVESRKVVSIEL